MKRRAFISTGLSLATLPLLSVFGVGVLAKPLSEQALTPFLESLMLDSQLIFFDSRFAEGRNLSLAALNFDIKSLDTKGSSYTMISKEEMDVSSGQFISGITTESDWLVIRESLRNKGFFLQGEVLFKNDAGNTLFAWKLLKQV